jgi:CysZ protein
MNSVSNGSAGLVTSPYYIIRGASFLRHNRKLWKYAAAPLIISILILSASYGILYYILTGIYASYFSQSSYSEVLFYVLIAVISALFLVIFFFIFTRVVSAIASPFNDLLSQKTEQLIAGFYEETHVSYLRILKNSTRAIMHAFKILGVYIGLLLLCLLFFVIPVIGQILFTISGAVLSAFMIAYEYFSYPMDRREYTWAMKKEFLKKHKMSALSFGLGCVGVASIPLVNIFFVPAAVIGGTILFLDLEKRAK